jgi:inorganic pyrophosphatase/exopolyphosphatase
MSTEGDCPSDLDAALALHEHEVAALLATYRSSSDTLSGALSVPAFELPVGCVFVGHTATDMDSIGSAVGAAELFDGVAARASDVNTETQFALDYFHVPCPPPFLEVGVGRPVCLVDHNQVSQMTVGINHSLVKGIIDHHAMQSGTLVSDVPLYVDIRPWGSACTIVAHSFLTRHRPIKAPTAGLLLCGILSDTLNLRSPTTTRADRLLAALLTQAANVADANDLAAQLFKAKSKMLSLLTPHSLVGGDNKTFCFKSPENIEVKIAFGVVETVDASAVMSLKDELLTELRAHKHEQNVDFSFLAVVDIVNLSSVLLLCGPDEEALALAAFGGSCMSP